MRKRILFGKKILNVILILSILFINLARVTVVQASPPAQEPLSDEFEIHIVQEDKQEEILSASSLSALASGGPDSWGYLYEDSNDPLNGPTYNWIEISNTGTNIPLTDDSYARLSLPFSFFFYGSQFSSVSIGSNGTIYFQNDYLGYNNKIIPGPSSYGVDAFIAVFWDDLNPSAGGAVWYDVQGEAGNRRLIIEWQNVSRYGTSGDLTFEIILSEGSGEVLIQYQDVTTGSSSYDYGQSATVGIQANTSLGLQYSYNSPSLSNGLALRFRPPQCALSAAAIAGQSRIFLPVISKGSSGSSFVTTTDTCNTTNTSGEVTFYDDIGNGQVEVSVTNESGTPLNNIDLFFYSNGNTVWVLAVDPQGVYLPKLVSGEYSSATDSGAQLFDDFGKPLRDTDSQIKPQVVWFIAIPIILIGGGIGAYHGYHLVEEVYENPPRVDLELGYTEVCMTYDTFIHAAGIGSAAGSAVLAVYTGGSHLLIHYLGHEGAAFAVAEGALLIDDWVEDGTGWDGYFCFRKSHFGGKTWFIPYTDLIRPSEFIADLRWDKLDTDVDLHIYDSLGNHAYYADKDGVPGGALDRDDTDGFGPEVYTQFSYEGANYYDISVHYYSDHGNGPTTAVVKVYDEDGHLIGTYTKTLSNGDWWHIRRMSVN